MTFDFFQALGYTIHASNSLEGWSDAVCQILHGLGEDMLAEPRVSASEFNQQVWAQTMLLQRPKITILVGDTLTAEKQHTHQNNVLLLPQTTSLDSTSALLKAARIKFNANLFDWLDDEAPAQLGAVKFRDRGPAKIGALCFLVCREPSNPEPLALAECLEALPKKTRQQYVLPIWQATKYLEKWVTALAAWAKHAENADYLATVQPMLIKFQPEEEKYADELEVALIRQGVLVGRDFNEGQTLRQNSDMADRIAQLVSSDGRMTPQVYAQWLYSGIQLPEDAWQRHYQVFRDLKRAGQND